MGKYQSIHTGAQIDDAVGKVANNEATNGQVLMANGGGGAEWKDLQKQDVGLAFFYFQFRLFITSYYHCFSCRKCSLH